VQFDKANDGQHYSLLTLNIILRRFWYARSCIMCMIGKTKRRYSLRSY